MEVASKLGVEILILPAVAATSNQLADLEPHGTGKRFPDSGETDANSSGACPLSFDQIWTDHVMPLSGQVLQGKGTRSNTIEKVDWAGVQRISSTGKSSRIGIEIFRLAINHILRNGSITRDEINQNYAKRASSGVVLILAQVPIFDLTEGPLTLRLSRVHLPQASDDESLSLTE